MALVAGGRMPSSQRPQQRSVYTPYRQRARSFGSMFLLHFVLAGAAAFGAATFPSSAWAYVALAIFASMCLGLLRTSPATFLLFVPLLTARITEFISGAAIESGAYMIETTTYGHATGAFTRLLLIYLLFFLVATFATEAMWPRLKIVFREAPTRWEKQAKLIWTALLIVMLVASVYLIRLGLNNGFPLFNHIDRFAYLERIDSPIYKAFLLNRIILVPFLGALFALPAYRSRSGLMLIWLLATSIIFGEKFSSLVGILSFFGIPAGLVHIANDRKIPINFIAGISVAIVVVTVPAVLIAYGAMTDFDGATKRYGQRVALQGQLWFVTDDKYLAPYRLDDQALAADIGSWLKPSEQQATKAGTRFGLYYVMQRFTPTTTLGWTMDGGGGFVFSFYPYLLLTMGMVGLLIVSTIIALCHAVVMRLLALAIGEGSWVAALAMGRVMSSVYATYATGYLWNIFGIKTLLTVALAIFLLWEARRRTSVTRRFIAQASDRLSRR